jgi:hypothetical protein
MPDSVAGAAQVSNSQFLAELARSAPNGTTIWVTAFRGSPDLTEVSNWFGGPYHGRQVVDMWADRNAYFAVAALKPNSEGEVRRLKDCFSRLLVLVADDMHPDDLRGAPSYVLETSPGKHQIGVFIDLGDAAAASLPMVRALKMRMADAGLIRADKSGNNAVRYVRLPAGQNQKPRDSGHWQCRLTAWSPGVRLSLEDAAAVFGIDMDSVRAMPEAVDGVGPYAGRQFDQQGDRFREQTRSILQGEELHESINGIASSLIASGARPGAVVNMLRGLMDASAALRDERWQNRYENIPRAVSTAQEKFEPGETPEAIAAALPLVWAEDVSAEQAAIPQLVEDVLTAGGLSVMYGESNSGKSFLACDMACAIGSGREWLGKRTVAGAVLYVAGEGSQSIKLRVLAWRQRHGVNPAVAIVPCAVNMLDRGADVRKVVEACEAVQAHYGMPVSLIVIDTLARAFGGGNENASEDMGAVISNADRVRDKSNAHVLFVHHAGKDVSKGSRGHSSLKAATDTEIEVVGDSETKLHTAKITKQRDLGSRGEELVSKFHVVHMGVDQWGKPVTTCVVEQTTERSEPVIPSKVKGDKLHGALIAALSLAPNKTMKRAELVKTLTEQGFSTSPIYRRVADLSAQGVVTEVLNMVHLVGSGPKDRA